MNNDTKEYGQGLWADFFVSFEVILMAWKDESI